MVAAVLEVYQSEHARLNRPARSVEFFSEQAERAREELAARQEALRDLKTASGIVSPADQRQTFALRLSRLEDDLLQTQAAGKVSETRVETLRRQLAALPAEEVELVTTGIGNEAADQMRAALYQLEIRREEAAAKYTDAHPAKQAIDEQVQASRAAANTQEATRTHVAKGQSRVYQETQTALLQEQALLAAAQAKVDVLNQQLAGVRGQLKEFNRQELLIAGLERDVDVCQANYRKYAAGLEQSRIDRAQEIERISNITVPNRRRSSRRSCFPRKALFWKSAYCAGCWQASPWPVGPQARDRSFREPEDVERRLGINVLGTIPRFVVQPSTSNGKKR